MSDCFALVNLVGFSTGISIISPQLGSLVELDTAAIDVAAAKV